MVEIIEGSNLLSARTTLINVLTSKEIGTWGESESDLVETVLTLSPELLFRFAVEAYRFVCTKFTEGNRLVKDCKRVLYLLGGKWYA